MKRSLLIKSIQQPLAYEKAYQEQLKNIEKIASSKTSPYVLNFLEHQPVMTLGKTFEQHHLAFSEKVLNEKGVSVVDVNRGGSITYHAPGQLVIYLHIHLKELKLFLTSYLRDLEQWVIDFLNLYDIQAERIEGMTGVWVNGAKISAMGIAAKKYITYHGLALNLDLDLEPFDWMIPCGLIGKPVTSLEKLIQSKINRKTIEKQLLSVLPPWLKDLSISTPTQK